MKQLAAIGGVSAGDMLRKIGVVGLTAGALLVSYSGLEGASAAANLLCDKQTEVAQVSSVALQPSVVGGGDDAGTGYVKKDHGWVRMTKVARSGVQIFEAQVAMRALPSLGYVQGRAHTHAATVAVQSEKAIEKCNSIAITYEQITDVSAGINVGRGLASIKVNPCAVEWLGLDEIMAIVEMGR
jgi:hypothetical protein